MSAARAAVRPRVSPAAAAGTGSRRRLVAALCLVVVADLVGGLLAVAADVNTWTEAWGGSALLAAPLPMIVAQVVLAWIAVRGPRRGAAVAGVLLAVACLLSVVSGFFDGGLRNAELGPELFAYQVLLLTLTGWLGLQSALRVRSLLRG